MYFADFIQDETASGTDEQGFELRRFAEQELATSVRLAREQARKLGDHYDEARKLGDHYDEARKLGDHYDEARKLGGHFAKKQTQSPNVFLFLIDDMGE